MDYLFQASLSFLLHALCQAKLFVYIIIWGNQLKCLFRITYIFIISLFRLQGEPDRWCR